MSVLYFLEGVRTDLLNFVFSAITTLGEEMLFIVIGVVIFWCINKKQGYYVLSVGLFATVINQFLKILCRVPRPWVRDPNLTTVGQSVNGAPGYSFPSGHSSAAVALYGSISKTYKNKVLRILCAAAALLVPFSRLYLGVHTLEDVLVGSILSLVLVFLLYPFMVTSPNADRNTTYIIAVLTAFCVGFVIYVSFYPFPADVDAENLNSAIDNAYKMLGVSLGVLIGNIIDKKYTDFSTEGSLLGQILKTAIGLGMLLGIKSGTKSLLISLIGNSSVASCIRYFLIAIFAVAIWPLAFPVFSKIGKKK